MFTLKKRNKFAIVIQANHPSLPNYDRKEFEGLAKAAGYTLIHYYSQNLKKINSRYLIGMGKLEEIIHNQSHDFASQFELIPTKIEKRREEDLIYIFMNRLKPNQIRNLSGALQTKVIDRDLLILEIFEAHATTREAKIQIKLARLYLEASRKQKEISAKLVTERQGRDFMGKGYGAFEAYRRSFKEQKSSLVQELEVIRKQREIRRQARSDAYNVSIAGYTNAGKTTLLNTMKKLDLETKDSPFTTVSTTTKSLTVNGDEMTVSDSVGFVFDIPHEIIEAFLSTLEEITFSDCIILTLDISDPIPIILRKLQTTFQILVKIGAFQMPVLYFMNKIDKIELSDFEVKRAQLLAILPENSVIHFGSALEQDTIHHLTQKLYEIKNSLTPSTRMLSQESLMEMVEKINVTF
ncbi:MAG: GTPase HflX [Promethearchaeota archaeon]|nr:MAG: GTPase HflX [Candidatus Lokiarchaeota archaeon]